MALQQIPLSCYREWITTLPEVWAEYIAKCVINDVVYTSTLFIDEEREVEDELSDDNDEALAAMESEKMSFQFLAYIIDTTLKKNDSDAERRLCLQLLSSTNYLFSEFAESNPPIVPYLRKSQMQSFIVGKDKMADACDNLLNSEVAKHQSYLGNLNFKLSTTFLIPVLG